MTFIGYKENPSTKQMDRYLLKFPPHVPGSERNSMREVLFMYLFCESGYAEYISKTGIVKIGGNVCVIRKYFEGEDGRVVFQKNSDIPDVPIESIVEQYAIRYILFGDLDFHNPGNVIFSNEPPDFPEKNSASKKDGNAKHLIHIDGEGILPDKEVISLRVYEKTWSSQEQIPGSTAWRRELSEKLGAEKFVYKTLAADNPLLGYLKRRLHTDECVARSSFISVLLTDLGLSNH